MKKASRSVAWRQIIPPAALLLISLLAASPLWGPGLLNTRAGGDSPFLLLRTHQLVANLGAGVFPARWMPDAAYGFGYPFFSYYASLPYHLAAGFNLLGLDILTAIKLTQTLFLAAAALSAYWWTKQLLGSRVGGWVASVAYTVAPFHLVNVYVRGDSLSEFAAFALYPLILWGFDRLAARPSGWRTLFPALTYAALIVTHNVSALMFSPFLLLYVALHFTPLLPSSPDGPGGTARRRSLVLLAPLLMALLLSAWFWLPALAETGYVQLDSQTTGYFFYGNHFRGADLVQRALVFDYQTSEGETSPFAMGLVQAILALTGALVAAVPWAQSRLSGRSKTRSDADLGHRGEPAMSWRLAFGFFGFLISTWLMTPLARPLWDRLPLLPLVQFPWRFLSLQALFAALLTGFAVYRVAPNENLRAWACAMPVAALLVATALGGLQPEYLAITEEDVTTERLQLYELFTGNIGSTVRHEYLPKWVDPRPHTGPGHIWGNASPRCIPVEGTLLDAERLLYRPTRQTWYLETGPEGSETAFPLYYWPGWYAVVDGTRVQAKPARGSGYVSLDVPPGQHIVELRLGRTPLRLMAELASLITALLGVTWAAVAWSRRPGDRNRATGSDHREQRLNGPSSPWRVAVACAPFAVLLSLIVAFHPRVEAAQGHSETMDFESKPYLHDNPDGLSLNGWCLTTYEYEGTASDATAESAPGESLQVTINWREDEASTTRETAQSPTEVRLVSPAAVRHSELPAVAEASIDFSPGRASSMITHSTDVTLSVPRDTAPGIHLLQIPTSPPVYLRPLWVTVGQTLEDNEEPVRAAFADGALCLHDVQTKQRDANRLYTHLKWSATRPVAANYGLSLSLTDAANNEWLRQSERPGYDTQPGHGFLPTSLWPLDRLLSDHHAPSVYDGIPPGDDYQLTVSLYDVASWQSVGQYTTTLALTEVSRREDAPVVAQLGKELVLSEIQVPESVWQGQALRMTAFWWTRTQPSEDYVVEWQLDGPTTSIYGTKPLAPGSSPKQWPSGAWISGRTALSIPPATPPGEYTLSLALKKTAEGAALERYIHSEPIRIRERDRAWELPEMDHRVGARFGGAIELAGYDLHPAKQHLRVTLYWKALAAPEQHYMFFVHLADPETGDPASQVDTMPHSFVYPTGEWTAGEVVFDVVELPIEDVPAGRYVLAVGWYDPDTRQRLPAVDRDGTPLVDDRAILPSDVRLP